MRSDCIHKAECGDYSLYMCRKHCRPFGLAHNCTYQRVTMSKKEADKLLRDIRNNVEDIALHSAYNMDTIISEIQDPLVHLWP